MANNLTNTGQFNGSNSSENNNQQQNAVLNYRNQYRRDRDYSVLFFLIAWGFQVVDATVFGHLKQFDVTNNLSMQVRPQLDPISKNAGLSLTFQLKSRSPKTADAR
jgi:hypothetical protein